MSSKIFSLETCECRDYIADFTVSSNDTLRDRESRGRGLRWEHQETGARKVYDHLASARVVPANRDVLRRERDDLA
jgi:hypothetical protein